VPLVAEALGGLAEDTINGTSESTGTTSHLFGPLAVVFWQGNASLWLHRLPTLPPLDGVV